MFVLFSSQKLNQKTEWALHFEFPDPITKMGLWSQAATSFSERGMSGKLKKKIKKLTQINIARLDGDLYTVKITWNLSPYRRDLIHWDKCTRRCRKGPHRSHSHKGETRCSLGLLKLTGLINQSKLIQQKWGNLIFKNIIIRTILLNFWYMF